MNIHNYSLIWSQQWSICFLYVCYDQWQQLGLTNGFYGPHILAHGGMELDMFVSNTYCILDKEVVPFKRTHAWALHTSKKITAVAYIKNSCSSWYKILQELLKNNNHWIKIMMFSLRDETFGHSFKKFSINFIYMPNCLSSIE